MKSHWNFSQRTHLIHSIGPKTHVFVRFVVFGCICQCFITTRNLVQNGLNWCNQCTSLCHKVASEFSATNAPNPPHWTTHVLEHFVVFRAFGNVSLLHETRCKIGWTGAITGQVCAMKSHRKIFATNTPDPPHWTLNSWFGALHSVWLHLAMFH